MMYILKKRQFLIPSIFLLLFFSSCLNEKKLAYFQKGPTQSDTLAVLSSYQPKIGPGDILSVYVNSLSAEASTFFNPYSANVVPSDASTGASTQSSAPGFLVSGDGNITLPLIGSIKVNGLTVPEAHDIIEKKLTVFLKEPTVIVRFLNYKISVLGEVNKPGVYVIPNERITIPEAIAMAGDLTVYAKRVDIQVIRDINNKKEFGVVNLSDRSVFASPYYYLHTNDVIYIKADKSKSLQSDILLRIVPVLVSVVTVMILVFSK